LSEALRRDAQLPSTRALDDPGLGQVQPKSDRDMLGSGRDARLKKILDSCDYSRKDPCNAATAHPRCVHSSENPLIVTTLSNVSNRIRVSERRPIGPYRGRPHAARIGRPKRSAQECQQVVLHALASDPDGAASSGDRLGDLALAALREPNASSRNGLAARPILR